MDHRRPLPAQLRGVADRGYHLRPRAAAGLKSIGTDWAGNSFARGYQTAPAKLTETGKDTVEQLVYIRNALRSMVVRHNRAEDESNHVSEQVREKIEAVLIPGTTPT